jgi:hypothetical protein
MNVVLAATQHDPEGRLYDQTARTLPALANIFGGMAFLVSHATQERSLTLLGSAGAQVRLEIAEQRAASWRGLGLARRAAIELALGLEAPFILFCDFDRMIHWVERYPEELARVVTSLPEHDFTVLGRTERAFASHPRVQRDTEAIINHVYATIGGRPWDVTAAARGLSRSAAAAILEGCPDQSIGTDVSWPLFLQRIGSFTLGYIAAEGLEFETADRYGPEVAAAGGRERWMARLDADPHHWAQRLDLARVEVEAAVPYIGMYG